MPPIMTSRIRQIRRIGRINFNFKLEFDFSYNSFLHKQIVYHSGHNNRRKKAQDTTECKSNGETFYRAGTELEQAQR
jgi:hypothetical protein